MSLANSRFDFNHLEQMMPGQADSLAICFSDLTTMPLEEIDKKPRLEVTHVHKATLSEQQPDIGHHPTSRPNVDFSQSLDSS
jgi:hypothetical protein